MFVSFAVQEDGWFKNLEAHRLLGFSYDSSQVQEVVQLLRCVDDEIIVSNVYVGACFFFLAFEVRLSACSAVDPDAASEPHVWVGLCLYVVDDNRERVKTTIFHGWVARHKDYPYRIYWD